MSGDIQSLVGSKIINIHVSVDNYGKIVVVTDNGVLMVEPMMSELGDFNGNEVEIFEGTVDG